MKHNTLATLRLLRQQLEKPTHKTPETLVEWMGAMQAQDFAMAKWAVGIRVPGATDEAVTKALDAGKVLRTHVLRPTWHFVAAADIHWLRELSAPQIHAIARGRHRALGLDANVFAASYKVFEKTLRDHRHHTREELVAELAKAAITVDGIRAAHLMEQAELDGIVCSGAVKGGKQTYALLEERVPKSSSLPREEALVKLATRYFTSHGPATLADFGWWSGLSVTDARRGLEAAKTGLHSETIDGTTYWFAGQATATVKPAVHLLPAFDELVISYKDRSAVLSEEPHRRAVSSNGIFRPVILVDGHGIGLWKRTVKKEKVLIEPDYFGKVDTATRTLVDKAGEVYAAFLGKELA